MIRGEVGTLVQLGLIAPCHYKNSWPLMRSCHVFLDVPFRCSFLGVLFRCTRRR